MSAERRALNLVASIAILLIGPPRSLAAIADPSGLVARLQAAHQESSLEDASLKPWHLKLDVHLFDDKGNPAGDGTIEEWWSSPGHDRREYNTSAYKATEVRHGEKLYRTKGAGTPPYLLWVLRNEAVNPVALDNEDMSHAELRKQSFGKVQLECIMLSQAYERGGFSPLGLFPTYCFDRGKDDLRISLGFGDETILRNGMATFQKKVVSTQVSVLTGATTLATSHISKLETFSPSANEQTGELEEQKSSPVKVESKVMADKIISQAQPVYPQSAKENRISGDVVLHAIIGSDGHIHWLRVVSASDADLAISAIVAVRQWVYTPYLLMGVPVDVDTTIKVTYKLQ